LPILAPTWEGLWFWRARSILVKLVSQLDLARILFAGDRLKGEFMNRREFMKLSVAAAALPTAGVMVGAADVRSETAGRTAGLSSPHRSYNGAYEGPTLSRVAFPLGGIGAGTICLDGTGALSHFSLRNRPDVFNEPGVFAALSVKGQKKVARVLEGPVPGWRLFGRPGNAAGGAEPGLGLPRFRDASFKAQFPFGEVTLVDDEVPLAVRITGWSPFEPGDADNSSLPVAALEYEFANHSSESVEAVFSFNSKHFLAIDKAPNEIRPAPGGFILLGEGMPDRPWDAAAFHVSVDDPNMKVNHAWFRGGWWDWLAMVWRDIADGACYECPPVSEGRPAPGASLFVPFQLGPGETKVITVRLAWYSGRANLRVGKDLPESVAGPKETYRPWYAGRFKDIAELAAYWHEHYGALRANAERFTRCFYSSTLPPEVIEAVAANFAILKSPTILRQTDGRLWGWEGCADQEGQGALCSHVWNYAQSIPHLFPALERTLRETEFGPSQNDRGEQTFRSGLPIRPIVHEEFDAADGQLGGIMKVHRDWRISGDTEWLRRIWPKVRVSLDYCIETWDPKHTGCLEEPQHNTYDIEFWGANGMCTSIYLGALQAATLMGRALGEKVDDYAVLFEKGTRRANEQLFDGEYFCQRIEWQNLRAKLPKDPKNWIGESFSTEAVALIEKEGPNYQYGPGCLSDGVIGSWFALVCGVGQVLDSGKVKSHLRAVHRNNLTRDLSSHANPDRSTYACGSEGGLLLCTWPKGGRASLPFVYSDEVWTGIEYQVASHLMLMGYVSEGLEIVRTCRNRYDGRVRNPFDEYEWGHWYARAMASYALLQGLSGARYDAVDKVLYLQPSLPGDFRCFLSTATGYGTVGVKEGKPFLETAGGTIEVREIRHSPPTQGAA
jgi:uncharacterized protein (DUF608 family)